MGNCLSNIFSVRGYNHNYIGVPSVKQILKANIVWFTKTRIWYVVYYIASVKKTETANAAAAVGISRELYAPEERTHWQWRKLFTYPFIVDVYVCVNETVRFIFLSNKFHLLSVHDYFRVFIRAIPPVAISSRFTGGRNIRRKNLQIIILLRFFLLLR